MKPSKYNIFFDYKNKKFAFNGLTCALVEVTEDFEDIMNSLDTIDEASLKEGMRGLVDSMKEAKYIINDNEDELSILKYKNYFGKFHNKTFGLTIAPTLSCNFACPYCYEQTKAGLMADDVKEAIYEQIERAAKRKENISISWYGGEPTLAKDIIIEMSEKMIKICEKHGVEYTAGLTSNCFLINDNFIKNMINAKIKTVQATLDGPPETHNSTRILKSGADTFDTIISNAQKMKKSGIDVQFRVNIGKFNSSNNFEELLNILIEKGLGDCSIKIGQIIEYNKSWSKISEQCLDTKEMAKELIEYYRMLIKKGFLSKSKQSYYPRPKTRFCSADSNNSFIVDPLGDLYKCWVEIGMKDSSFGNIKDFKNTDIISINKENIEYMTWSPFAYKKCLECNALPFCMGGCPHIAKQRGGEPDCITLKYNLLDMLKIYCDQELS